MRVCVCADLYEEDDPSREGEGAAEFLGGEAADHTLPCTTGGHKVRHTRCSPVVCEEKMVKKNISIRSARKRKSTQMKERKIRSTTLCEGNRNVRTHSDRVAVVEDVECQVLPHDREAHKPNVRQCRHQTHTHTHTHTQRGEREGEEGGTKRRPHAFPGY